MSVPPSKPLSTQAYETLSWMTGLGVSAASATASTIYSLLNLGINENPPFVQEMTAANNARQAAKEREFDRIWTNSPHQVIARQKMLEAAQAIRARTKPNPDWISESHLRDYGIRRPFTSDEKIAHGTRGNYVTCTESFYNALYKMDPATGHIYDRTTGELIPRKQASEDDFKK